MKPGRRKRQMVVQSIGSYDGCVEQMLKAIDRLIISLNSMQNHPDIKSLDSYAIIGNPLKAASEATVIAALESLKALNAAKAHLLMSLKFFKEIKDAQDSNEVA
jgi:hypothetical protein